MNISSKSPITREMQIKTTIEYHLTAIQMDIVKMTKDSNIFKDVEKIEPLHTLYENSN
jgi:hypothetical protein